MLEVIDKGHCTAAHPAPLLFVHGEWHSAWCWDAHFLDFFAERGFRAVAISLRAHGKSATSQPLRTCSIADYVDDVTTAADQLDARPVIVAHSMGGFVTQKFLQTYHAPACVLMASAPPQGTLRAALRMFRRHPFTVTRANTAGSTVDAVGTPSLARDHLFCAKTPESVVTDCVARLQPESALAIREMMFGDRPDPSRVTTPIMVLGAVADRAFTQDEIRATASAYNTQPQFFGDMGHNMMLEPGWLAVAEQIIRWLGHRGL
ncbi:alpha/beta hydrolase [Mycolicibacterium stellerae]|uniref:alpha/beta hydrolase n=1 Tax=Mycolicibacterium stellerae TaxID=2358193 RepID=UPI000F0B9FCD|nr:alpha/beta fold hydrolase [Mycolicibacterium stellerae]